MRNCCAVLVLAVLLGSAACGSETATGTVAPSATAPAPSATATPEPTTDGKALGRAVVAKFAADPFVAHVDQTGTATSGGVTAQVHGSIDVNGDDLRVVLVITAQGIEVETEMVALGDDVWIRIGDQTVKTTRGKTEAQLGSMTRGVRIVTDPTVLSYAGTEVIDGRELHHLTAPAEGVEYSDSNTKGHYDEFHLYALADGTPVLVRGAFSAKNDDGSEGTGTTEMRFSAFGGPITIEAPSFATSLGSPSLDADTATVAGLPGQREPWSGVAQCDEQVVGPVVWITVPAEANEHWVPFDVYVSTPPNAQMIVGGRPASVVETSGDAHSGRVVATVDALDQCRRTREGETPEPGAPKGYVCPYRDETATVTVTWTCPNR